MGNNTTRNSDLLEIGVNEYPDEEDVKPAPKKAKKGKSDESSESEEE